jgi:hypothetical protein
MEKKNTHNTHVCNKCDGTIVKDPIGDGCIAHGQQQTTLTQEVIQEATNV